MKSIITLLIIVLGNCIHIHAQIKSSEELKGDKYIFSNNFIKAIESYNEAKELTQEGQRNLAQSYRNLDSNQKAEVILKKLISANVGIVPLDYFNYAMLLKDNAKYEEAALSLDKFAALAPNDLRAKDYMANKQNLATMLKDDGKYKIYPQSINTDNIDFGTCYYKEKVVFSSSRTIKINPNEDSWNNKPYLDLYVADVENYQLKNPENFSRVLNGNMHDGPASFTKDGNTIAFTRNNYSDETKDRIVELQIFFSTWENGEWTEPVPFIHNGPKYSVGQPCLTADGKTMYFTSDMPGGYGGADLYRTKKDNSGVWSKPENLGKQINTESDEMFPFFEENASVLLFSSNGRYGLGGLDIFKCDVNTSGFGVVRNMGYPMNTQYDDFAAIVNSKMTQGYMSSNRPGGKGADDIYAIGILNPKYSKRIQGIAKENNGTPIANALVTIFDENNKIIDTSNSKSNGSFFFIVEVDKNFKLSGSKIDYTDGTNTASTFGKDYIVNADLILLKKLDNKKVAEQIKSKSDLAVILDLGTIYFDLDQSAIRPDAEVELNKISKIMNEYPKMIVEVRSYTDCRASAGYNQVLSDKRAVSTIQYIRKRISKPSRISGKGYGEAKESIDCPCENEVTTDCSDNEYQRQRNTKFIITSQ